MKLQTKRIFGSLFEKGKITIENDSELLQLRIASRNQIGKYEKQGWDSDSEMKEGYQNLLKIWDALNPENEMPW